MVDSRILHTQNSLTRAIYELASEHPVSEIAVSEIARRAGINRATFYNHYLSPGTLLASAVTRELDRVRDGDRVLRSRPGTPGKDATRQAVSAVVELVERNRRMFELGLLDPQDASLHRALAAHLEVSCRLHIDTRAPNSGAVLNVDIAARFVAEGIVGGIEAWLGKPSVEASELTDTIMAAMPVWWD